MKTIDDRADRAARARRGGENFAPIRAAHITAGRHINFAGFELVERFGQQAERFFLRAMHVNHNHRHGAAGAVINGFHRDTPQMLSQNWPVFSRGRYAQDSSVRTKVVDFRCALEVGGVWIEPGDLVFGDLDGVVIVPRKHEKEVIAKALEKARGEKLVRKEIEAGMSSTAAFKKYGIL